MTLDDVERDAVHEARLRLAFDPSMPAELRAEARARLAALDLAGVDLAVLDHDDLETLEALCVKALGKAPAPPTEVDERIAAADAFLAAQARLRAVWPDHDELHAPSPAAPTVALAAACARCASLNLPPARLEQIFERLRTALAEEPLADDDTVEDAEVVEDDEEHEDDEDES